MNYYDYVKLANLLQITFGQLIFVSQQSISSGQKVHITTFTDFLMTSDGNQIYPFVVLGCECKETIQESKKARTNISLQFF